MLSICQHYNSSKTFEAFGFGAKLPNQSSVSAIFPLDLQRGTSEVVGITGVMTAYRHALSNVQLYGPTNFAPIIENVARKAQNMIHDSARYQILLIITDGIISDMHATIRSIISVSFILFFLFIIKIYFRYFRLLDYHSQLLSLVLETKTLRKCTSWIAMMLFFNRIRESHNGTSSSL